MSDFLEITKARPIVQSNSAKKGVEYFTIISYNILADGHAQRDYKNAPFITAENLNERERHKKILAELKILDADIVCLQEVGTTYFPILLKNMQTLGYDGKFVSRQAELGFEGEATFYKTCKFQLVESIDVNLNDCIDVYINGLPDIPDDVKEKMIASLGTYTVSKIFQLRSVICSFDVVVGNAHIGYEKLERPDKQCIQIHMIMKKLVNLLTQINTQQTCSIICGDFNSWPNTAPNVLMKTGILNDQNIADLKNIPAGDGLKGKSIIELLPELFMLPIGYMYKSAYEEILGADQISTRYNFNNLLKAVDYIYYDADKISPVGVTRLVDENWLVGGAPNNVLPSDHLSLRAEFSFK